jgi:hypothetical protein
MARLQSFSEEYRGWNREYQDDETVNQQASRILHNFICRFKYSLLYMFCFRSVVLIALACSSFYICYYHLLWAFDVNITLVSTGLIFPICFSLSESFKRREAVLTGVATMKSIACSYYLMARDWTLDRSDTETVEAYRILLRHFLYQTERYFNYRTLEQKVCHLEEITQTCHTLSVLNERSAVRAGYVKGGEGGWGRGNVQIKDLLNEFEKLRIVKDYRTPIGLSAFCNGLMQMLPALMGPAYAFAADKNCVTPSGCAGAGYYLACLLSIVVAGLYEV